MKSTGSFRSSQIDQQIIWRRKNITVTAPGTQSKDRYTKEPVYHMHILPKRNWKDSLWSPIKDKLNEYLHDPVNPVQSHTGTHNLLSSWVLCSNIYFLVRIYPGMQKLMTEFLKLKISSDIQEVTDTELEFAFKSNDALHPSKLLGEEEGIRGSGQTSPDVAFLVNTSKGKGLILTECKYTEKEFYMCSARKTKPREHRINNPDPGRCIVPAALCDYRKICHQKVWGRKYWDNLKLSEHGLKALKCCPAATHGYQLFRQQSLAEGIMKSGRYTLVASSVAFDERNDELKGCLKRTGILDFQSGWGEIFEGRAIFRTWTHQEWVAFVRKNQVNGQFNDWLRYVSERYGY